MKPQIILTSYIRLKYLVPTVESLRQDDVELYIVDGGSDDETIKFIKQNADGYLLFKDNPGADYLKTTGIKKFVTNDEFIITSDDLIYPAGYSKQILKNYRTINQDGLKWDFVACGKPVLETKGYVERFITVKGIDVWPAHNSQVAGAIINTALCKSVGYFPHYGKSGQGDLSYSKRMRDRGIKIGYWRNVYIDHIGAAKFRDFPEYSAAFIADHAIYESIGKEDPEGKDDV